MRTKEYFSGVLLLSSIGLLVSAIFFVFDLLRPFELKFYDFLMRNFSSKEAEQRVCLIYIDQSTLDYFAQEKITWPLPRQIYAPLIEYLAESEAVFLDIIFSENSSYGVEDDRILAEAVKRAGNVYLPFVLSKANREFDSHVIERMSIRAEHFNVIQFNSAILPIDELLKVSKGLGSVSIYPDEDGVYRRMYLFSKLGDSLVPTLVTSYFFVNQSLKVEGKSVFINQSRVPTVEGAFLIGFSRDGKPRCLFSFGEILRHALSNDKGMRDFLRGKVIFIGLTAAGLFDLKPSPVDPKTPGVLIHATAFSNLLNRDFIYPVPKFVIFLLSAIFSLIIPAIVLRHYSLKLNGLFLASLLVMLLLTTVVLFTKSIYVEAILPLFSLIFTATSTLLYSYAVEGRQRNFIKRVFSQYMDKRIVNYLLENPELLRHGGYRDEVTVFFADIENYTSITEKLSPEDTAMMLHRIFNVITDVVIRNCGLVDKYIGDCVMAFWGYPLRSSRSASDACNAALDSVKGVEKISNELAERGLPKIELKVGIHTGEAIVGNIGSDRHFNFTVIGDTVNVASRLESLNKTFRTKILISERVREKVSEEFVLRFIGSVRIKGRDEPVNVYELVGRKEELSDRQLELVRRFHSAYGLMREFKLKESKEGFIKLLMDFPDDYPSKYYLSLIEKLEGEQELTEESFVVKNEKSDV